MRASFDAFVGRMNSFDGLASDAGNWIFLVEVGAGDSEDSFAVGLLALVRAILSICLVLFRFRG